MTKPLTFIGIIPARFQSSRFPGKPLADINGKPMFWHVYQRAKAAGLFSQILLATDNDQILAAAKTHDVPAVMTREDHPSGTDRVLEAAQSIGADDSAVIVNIQGDEPALHPEMLTELVTPFDQDKDVSVSTLIRQISADEADNPDIVKVVTDTRHKAIYFSRSKIPYNRDGQPCTYYGHIGLYAFKMAALKTFVSLPQGALETTEKLEQLRLLENNIDIHTTMTRHESIGVDRPEDLEKVKKKIA